MKFALVGFWYLICGLAAGGNALAAEPLFRSGYWKRDFPKITFNSSFLILRGKPSNNKLVVGIVFRNESGSERYCSGIWISNQYIVTAKHCTCGSVDYRVTLGPDFFGGGFVSAEFVDQFGRDCNTINDMVPGAGDDLALLKLVGAPSVCPFSLRDEIPAAVDVARGGRKNLMVIGYGLDPVGPVGEFTRREARVPSNSFTCLEQTARALTCAPLKEFILGAFQPAAKATDACGGDSGGGVFMDRSGSLLPVGVVSRGLPIPQYYANGACGSGGIYTHLGLATVAVWLERNHVPKSVDPASQAACSGGVKF